MDENIRFLIQDIFCEHVASSTSFPYLISFTLGLKTKT